MIGALHRKIGVYENAQADLPEVEEQRDRAVLKAQAILEEIAPGVGLDSAAGLILETKIRRAIEHLLSAHSDLTGSLKAAQKNKTEIADELEELKQSQTGLPQAVEIPGLTATLNSAEKDEDGETRVAEIGAKLKVARDEARTRLLRLIPEEIGLEEAAGLAIPGRETVSVFQGRFQKAESVRENIEDRIGEQIRKARELELDIKKTREADLLPSETDLENARGRRQAGWELIKGEWLEGSVDRAAKDEYTQGRDLAASYEADVGTADEIADRLRRDAERVARMAAMTIECRDCLENAESLNRKLEETRQAGDELQAQWRDIWKPARIEPRTPPEMMGWLNDFEKLARSVDEIRELEQEEDRERRRVEKHRGALSACLKETLPVEVLESSTLKGLLNAARQAADRYEAVSKKHMELQTRVQSAQLRLRKTSKDELMLQERLDGWGGEWRSVISQSNAPKDLDPSFAEEYLRRTHELQTHLNEIREAELRIGRMKEAVQSFIGEVSKLALEVAPEFGHLPPEQAAAKLNALLNEHKKRETRRKDLEESLKEQEQDWEESAITLRSLEEEAQRLLGEAKCRDEEELPKREEESGEVKALRERRGRLEEIIRTHGGGKSLEALIEEASEIEPDRLAGEREALDRDLENLRGRIEVNQRELGALQKELDSLDRRTDAVTASEDAENHIARIQEFAREYARQKIAAELLRREFEFYKEQRGPELKRAGELFCRFTLGSFERLVVDLDQNDQPLLKGKPHGRDPIAANLMSDGARDQLYLALRLALLEQYMKRNEPLPILLDDVFVHFDDQRAGAALKVIGDLGRDYQILLFTHHRHLVDLAGRTLGADNFKLHTLG